MQQMMARNDPAPSRLGYRYQRLMLTPLFRLSLRVFLPFLLTMGAGGLWLSDQERRDSIMLALQDIRHSIETRPEFMVNVMAIDGASENTSENIRALAPLDFPISSFDLDLDALQQKITGLDAVERATVRIRPGGIMQIDVSERAPVALWRGRQGLVLVDREGFVVATAKERDTLSGLPLIAGDKAADKVLEALALMAAAGPLTPRVAGLVRVGERRWDVVLDRDQRIMLPAEGAVQALERVIALGQAQDMLARDVVAVDMRIASRPTIRIAQRAVADWWRIRQMTIERAGQ